MARAQRHHRTGDGDATVAGTPPRSVLLPGSAQEGGRPSLGQSVGAQSSPKGMMSHGRVRGMGEPPFREL